MKSLRANSNMRNARIGGLIYLLLILVAPFGLIYVPNTLFVTGNAAATANNIVTHEMLFRFGLVGDLIAGTISLFLTLALYRLFKGVNKYIALTMLFLGFMDTPLYFFNALNEVAALILAKGADFLSVFNQPQRDALAMLFLRMHSQMIVCAEIFWGLWLLPLATLVFRSGFLPRFLAIWLAINGIDYLVLSFTGLLLPQNEVPSSIAFIAQLGEVAFMLWLLVMGARPSAVRWADEPAHDANNAGLVSQPTSLRMRRLRAIESFHDLLLIHVFGKTLHAGCDFVVGHQTQCCTSAEHFERASDSSGAIEQHGLLCLRLTCLGKQFGEQGGRFLVQCVTLYLGNVRHGCHIGMESHRCEYPFDKDCPVRAAGIIDQTLPQIIGILVRIRCDREQD